MVGTKHTRTRLVAGAGIEPASLGYEPSKETTPPPCNVLYLYNRRPASKKVRSFTDFSEIFLSEHFFASYHLREHEPEKGSFRSQDFFQLAGTSCPPSGCDGGSKTNFPITLVSAEFCGFTESRSSPFSAILRI